MNFLVVIPARSGSKGVPNKNIKLLGNKPLIHYSIEAARKVFPDENIYISTDHEQIKAKAEETGIIVPFLRPAHLATDHSSMYDVLIHAVEFAEKNGQSPDVLVLLQPTSPFRNHLHIKEALKLYNSTLDMVVSVKQAEANPYYSLFEEDKKGFLQKSKTGDFAIRQECPKVWQYNGAIYIINVQKLKQQPLHKFNQIIKYEMDDISSHDIDTKLDWMLAEAIIKHQKSNNKSL